MGYGLRDIFIDNINMMGFNILLAVIPIVLGWLMFKTSQHMLRATLALVWFAFLPNTLYILTDLRYIVWQLNALGTFGKMVITVQYFVYVMIGCTSFVLALYPFEKLCAGTLRPENNWLLSCCLCAMNFIIGFGIVLGRVQRINSWDILVDTPRVVDASLRILSSLEMLFMVLFFGLLANFFYLLFSSLRVGLAVPARGSE